MIEFYENQIEDLMDSLEDILEVLPENYPADSGVSQEEWTARISAAYATVERAKRLVVNK